MIPSLCKPFFRLGLFHKRQIRHIGTLPHYLFPNSYEKTQELLKNAKPINASLELDKTAEKIENTIQFNPTPNPYALRFFPSDDEE